MTWGVDRKGFVGGVGWSGVGEHTKNCWAGRFGNAAIDSSLRELRLGLSGHLLLVKQKGKGKERKLEEEAGVPGAAERPSWSTEEPA